jgi:hypothetical protein
MFHVVNISTSEPITAIETGTPIAFATGELAAQEAKRLTDETGIRHQPRRILTDDSAWIQREAAKFLNGTYIPTPWHNESWFKDRYPLHFAHVSTDKPGMVAYTESPDKGQLDRQMRINPGVYLTKYFSDVLSQSTITYLARCFAAKYEVSELKFATTREDMVAVYLDGPSSCMSHRTSDYKSCPTHPVATYAAGDLTLAYITDSSDHCVARALVWDKKKQHSRIYADSPDHERRLADALRDLGYDPDWDFDGARLLRIECDAGIVAPYVDGHDYAYDDGEHLIISDRGDVSLSETSGIGADNNDATCECCGDRYDSESEGVYIDSREEHWCDSCYQHHAFYCDVTSEYIANSDGVRLNDGSYMSEHAFERYGFYCGATDANYDGREMDYVAMSNGEVWCQDYFDENGFNCPECGENFPNEEKDAESGMCKSCAEETAATRAREALEEAGQIPLDLGIAA